MNDKTVSGNRNSGRRKRLKSDAPKAQEERQASELGEGSASAFTSPSTCGGTGRPVSFERWAALWVSDTATNAIQDPSDWLHIDRPLPVEEFRGWHWIELAKFLDVPGARDLDVALEDEAADFDAAERKLLLATRKFLSFMSYVIKVHEPDSRHYCDARKLTKGVRAFVIKLSAAAEGLDYAAPLWKGLSKVKEDGQFLEFTAALLKHMWT